MPFKGYEINSTFGEPTSGGRPYFAEGYYLFEVAGIDASPEDLPEDNKPFWSYSLRTLEGPSNVGRTMRHRGYFGDKQFSNAYIMAVADPDLAAKMASRAVKSYKEHADLANRVAQRIKGKKIGALIADGQIYNGKPQSEIQETFNEEEYRRRKEAVGDNGVVVAAAPGTNGSSADAIAASADDIFNIL